MSQTLNLYVIRHFPTMPPAETSLEHMTVSPLIGATDWPARIPDSWEPDLAQDWLRIQKVHADHILWYSSPKQRCRQTCNYLQKAFACQTVPDLVPAWQEQDFGLWERQSWSDITNYDPANYQKFWQDPYHHSPPQGESFADLHQRSLEHLSLFLEQADPQYSHFVICHAGIQRSLMQYALDLTPETSLRLTFSPGHYCHLKFYQNDAGFIPTVTTVNAAFPFCPYS